MTMFAMVMKAPVWFLIDRLSELTGGEGRADRFHSQSLQRVVAVRHRVHGSLGCQPESLRAHYSAGPTDLWNVGGSEYKLGGAGQSAYASDRRSTGLALIPRFRATVMTSVAMDMPMRLLGT